jgi:hypothetical protein
VQVAMAFHSSPMMMGGSTAGAFNASPITVAQCPPPIPPLATLPPASHGVCSVL